MEIHPRKQPVQPRARATCAAIEEATAQILVADGRDALNTNAIALRAGVSVGSLYQYYPTKESILAQLVRTMRAEMLVDLREAAQRVDGAPLAVALREMIRASLAHHQRAPVLAAALERVEDHLPLDEETAAMKSEVYELASGLLHARGITDPDAPSDIAAIVRALAEVAARNGDTDYAHVCDRSYRAVSGYLGMVAEHG